MACETGTDDAAASGVVLDVLRCSLHDGPGIRTTVFLKGCPLSCIWCHNPESRVRQPVLWFNEGRCSQCGRCVAVCAHGVHRVDGPKHAIDRSRCIACGACAASCPAQAMEIKGRRMTVGQVMAEVLKDAEYYRSSGGGVTLSGGEPMLQFEFSLALARAAREQGIHTAMETSGMGREQEYLAIAPWIDLFLFDYKDTDSDRHVQHTGVENRRILQNLDRLCAAGARILLRCPLVPGVNDSDDHLAAIAALRKRYPGLVGIEVMPYHAMGNEKARRVGMPVTLDLPNAGAADKQRWQTALASYGCDVVMAD